MTKKFSLEHFSEADFIPPDLSKIPEVRGKIRTSINFNHDEGSIGIVLADDEIVDGDDLRTWMHTLSGDASDVPMEGFPNLKVAEDQFYRPLLNVSFYHLSDRALMEYVFVPRQAEIEEKIKKIWRKHIKEVGRQLGYDMVGRFYSEKEDAVADLEDPDYFMLEELRSSLKTT